MNSLPPRPSFLPVPPQASPASAGVVNPGQQGRPQGPPRLTHSLPTNPSFAASSQQATAPFAYAAPSGPVYSKSGVNIAAFAGQAGLGGGYGAWPAGAYQQPQQQQQRAWAGGYSAAYGGGGDYSAPPPQVTPVASTSYAAVSTFAPLPSSYASQPAAGPSSSGPRPPPRPKAPKLDLNRITSAPMRNCALPSCSFLGTVKDVELHEMDRHLIFPPGYVERKKSRPDGPLSAIQFNRKLETEEQISAWIQERKKKWPTAERAAEKEKQREEALARGEIPRDSFRGRGRGRGQDRGRGPGRGGRGGRGGAANNGFRQDRERGDNGYGGVGKGKARERSTKVRPVGDGADDFDSDPLSSSGSSSSGSSASSSDDSSDDDAPPRPQTAKRRRPSTSSSSSSSSGSDSDPDAPPAELSTASLAPPTTSDRPVCVYFTLPRGCNLGASCRFSHDIPPPAPGANPDALAPARLPKPVQPPRPGSNTSARPSLAARLLEGEVRHTTSALAQVIRFLCDNDLLAGVEVRVGQAEEQAESGIQAVRPVSKIVADKSTKEDETLAEEKAVMEVLEVPPQSTEPML